MLAPGLERDGGLQQLLLLRLSLLPLQSRKLRPRKSLLLKRQNEANQ